MAHKTAKQLAENQCLNGSDELFSLMVNSYTGEMGMGYCVGLYKQLTASAQNQLLNFCEQNNDTDAYNFYHSLT